MSLLFSFGRDKAQVSCFSTEGWNINSKHLDCGNGLQFECAEEMEIQLPFSGHYGMFLYLRVLKYYLFLLLSSQYVGLNVLEIII